MVCHETYKDINNKWLTPNEIEKNEKGELVKISDKTRVVAGPSEAMSKSKKNIIDPENMIDTYGADAVRWFILSDSPPEKDVQWSEEGIAASFTVKVAFNVRLICAIKLILISTSECFTSFNGSAIFSLERSIDLFNTSSKKTIFPSLLDILPSSRLMKPKDRW